MTSNVCSVKLHRMSTRDRNAVDTAMEQVYASFDQLLRLIEEGALDDITEAQRRRYSTQLAQLQNRAVFVERLLVADLVRRLSAAG